MRGARYWTGVSALALAAVTGCGVGSAPEAKTTAPPTFGVTSKSVQGRAFGGQSPIAGAAVYVFAAGNSAQAAVYGTGAASLLSSAVVAQGGGQDANGNFYAVTDAGGNFSVTGDYVCPASVVSGGKTFNPEIYLAVIGGNPGGGTNALSVEIAALGPCAPGADISSSVPFVIVNEVSTVGAVWALQQFLSPPTGVAGSFSIGAPVTNLQGLQNAFAMVPQLVDTATGTTAAVIGTASPEAAKINTLANVLAACINSNNTSGMCANLLASVTPASTAMSTSGVAASALNAPADTLQAAWYLAQFPANIASGSCGVSGAAFACVSGDAPFAGFSAAPNDWTIAVGFAPKVNNVVAVNAPFGVAVDAFGNAWLTNNGTNSVVALSPSGAALFAPVTTYPVQANSGYAATLAGMGVSAAGYTRTMSHPRGIAVDSNGNVWVADNNGSSATSGETAITGSSFTCPGTSGETCYFGTVAKFPAATDAGVVNASGVVGYYTPSFPVAAGGDASGRMFFTFAGGSTTYGSKVIGRLDGSGTYAAGVSIGSNPYGMAIDNNTAAPGGPLVWVADQKACTTTTGILGTAGVVLQMGSTSLAVVPNTGLTGANTGCTSSVHDTIAASTGPMLGLAVDSANGVWMANSSTLFSNSGAGGGAVNTMTYMLPSATTGVVPTGIGGSVSTAIPSSAAAAGEGGLNNPQYVAVDGAGHAWVSNYNAASVSEFSVSGAGSAGMAIHALSGGTGFVHAEPGSALSNAEGIAVDAAGNVWVASIGSTAKYVTVLVGAAVPVGPVIPGKVGVTPSGALPTITSFTASPATISYGASSSLSWATDNATSVTLTDGVGNVVSGGSPMTVIPATSELYTLTATNAAGSVTATVQLTMSAVGTPVVSTASGMPRAQIFDYHITNQSVYAGKVYFLWGAAGVSQPSPVVASRYIPYARDPDKAHTLAWYQANHPDWVVYTCDRTTPAYGYTYASGNDMSVDITNPAMRDWFYSTYVEPEVHAGYPMIALDNISVTNWDSRCGHFDTNGVWVQQFTGVTNDSAYTASVQSWVQYLVGRLHSEGVGVVGNLTYPISNLAVLPAMRQMVNTVDMWIDEQGFTSHRDSNITDADWTAKFSFVRSVRDRFYVPINKTTDGTTMVSPVPSTEAGATTASRAQIDWSVANFLLYREAGTLLSVSGVNDFGYFADAPQLNLDLGSPAGVPVQTTGGVWERAYTGGAGHSAALVLVNPSSTQTVTVALPSGSWTDSNGFGYSGAATVGPNSALMMWQ